VGQQASNDFVAGLFSFRDGCGIGPRTFGARGATFCSHVKDEISVSQPSSQSHHQHDIDRDRCLAVFFPGLFDVARCLP
jgi:hypothetical protein